MGSAPIPAYIDGLIAAYRAGRAGRDLHLGYWDNPPDLGVSSAPGEFREAQARLTRRALAFGAAGPGERVLDVACGLGGTLARLAETRSGIRLTGLNIDPRQLALCRDIEPAEGGGLALVGAEACALPFADAVFDRVLCIEAMFHFPSRRRFFAEAARVLRRGGTLLMTDILLQPPANGAPWDAATVEAALRRDYGPWPEPWITLDAVSETAAAEGLTPLAHEDWTVQTLPSYRIVAPVERPSPRGHPDAGTVLRWLHEAGRLTYPVMTFQRS